MDTPIERFSLPNGILALLKEIHSAPLISHWIWYRVGSRDEIPGITGVSHWVEHMQFKGTPQFPAGVLDKAISREGGFWNAFTNLDWTAYFETLPAAKIDIALQLEADRMVNSLFDPDEVEAERTVIISERQGHENQPLFQLSEEVRAAAFRVHPYHHEVIGDLADLQTITREELYKHYCTYYVPNNAVLTLAGDFDTQEMKARVEEIFGILPRKGKPPRPSRAEPAQRGERRVTVEGSGETTYLQVVYHTPAATHDDFTPLIALGSLLAGPGSLSLFGGGGISNKTSRLYRALVERELAVSVTGGLYATIDPYLGGFTILVHPKSNVTAVMQALDEEIQRIQDTCPNIEELARAVKQARALFAYSSESITNQAFWLGLAEMFATYEWFTNYLSRLEAVTPTDVQRVAQTYLIPRNRVVGTYIPTSSSPNGAKE